MPRYGSLVQLADTVASKAISSGFESQMNYLGSRSNFYKNRLLIYNLNEPSFRGLVYRLVQKTLTLMRVVRLHHPLCFISDGIGRHIHAATKLVSGTSPPIRSAHHL